MKKLSEDVLEYKLAELDIDEQTRKSFKENYLETISDFLAYDCKENTRYPSYGIFALKIGKNARKRLYRALANLEVPRAFEKLETQDELTLERSIFDLPLTYAAINKLYRSGFNTLEDSLKQTTLSKQILGNNHFTEVTELMKQNNFEIKYVSLPDTTKLNDLFLPARLNVVENEQIIDNHDAWHLDYVNWALKPGREGIYDLADLKAFGLKRFELKYGYGFEEFLEKYGLMEIDKQADLVELKKMRLALKLLVDVHDNEFSEKQRQDVVKYAKTLTKEF